MEEIHKLRAQISSIVQTNFPTLDTGFVPNVQPPNDLQVSCLTHGKFANNSYFSAQSPQTISDGCFYRPSGRPQRSRSEGFLNRNQIYDFKRGRIPGHGHHRGCFYSSIVCSRRCPAAGVHCVSRGSAGQSLMAQRFLLPPKLLVWRFLIRMPYYVGLTIINPVWLSSLGKASLCTFSKPVKSSSGTEMIIPRFGPERWELPPIKATI